MRRENCHTPSQIKHYLAKVINKEEHRVREKDLERWRRTMRVVDHNSAFQYRTISMEICFQEKFDRGEIRNNGNESE